MNGGSIVTNVAVLTEDQEPIASLTVENYARMIEVGIVDFQDPIELLDGVIIEMTPEGERHVLVVSRLARWLNRGLEDERRIIRIAAPLTLPPTSQPEPDLALADLADSFGAHPTSAHLVIEVSQTSLRKDRDRKARIYAEAEIPQCWIVDLVHEAVVVHLDPSPVGYRAIKTYTPADSLDPGLFGIPPLDLAALFKHP